MATHLYDLALLVHAGGSKHANGLNGLDRRCKTAVRLPIISLFENYVKIYISGLKSSKIVGEHSIFKNSYAIQTS